MSSIINMNFHWKRPSAVPFPQVWRRFETKGSDGQVQKLKIQDLTPDRYEEAWEFSLKYLWTEEPISKALKITEDPSYMADLKKMYLKIMRQNVTLIALIDEPDNRQPIIALSFWAVRSINDKRLIRMCGSAAERTEKLYKALEEGINVFDKLKVDVYLEDSGTAVASEFRSQHFARNMIISSIDMGKRLGIAGKVVFLSNLRMSSLCRLEKLEPFREIFYDDFRDADGNIIVPVKEFKSIVYCGGIFW